MASLAERLVDQINTCVSPLCRACFKEIVKDLQVLEASASAPGFINSATGEKLPPEIQASLVKLREQLLIVLAKRVGGPEIVLPVVEVDATGQDMLDLQFDPEKQTIVLTLRKKD